MKNKKTNNMIGIFPILGLLLFSLIFMFIMTYSLKTGNLLTGNRFVIITKANDPEQFYSTVTIMGILGTIPLGGTIWLILTGFRKKQRKLFDEDLLKIAESFAEEIRNGKWDEFCNKNLPVTRNKRLISELKRRRPGFSENVYRDALASAMQNTR